MSRSVEGGIMNGDVSSSENSEAMEVMSADGNSEI